MAVELEHGDPKKPNGVPRYQEKRANQDMQSTTLGAEEKALLIRQVGSSVEL